MVETARALADAGLADRTIVLTGAMVPYAFGSSDGLFNLGSALSFAQVLPPGVYVAMNGQYFPLESRAQEPRERRLRGHRMIALDIEAAVGRHDDLHGHVAAGGRARRHQPVAGLSRLRLRSGARRRGRRAHAQRPESVRADAGRAAAARGDRREVRALPTARRYDPETEVTVTSGGTEAIFDAVAATRTTGRRSDRARAVLRLVRAGDRVERRRRRSSCRCSFPDYSIDWDAVAPRSHAADADDHAQHAAQSRRCGARPDDIARAHRARRAARAS